MGKIKGLDAISRSKYSHLEPCRVYNEISRHHALPCQVHGTEGPHMKDQPFLKTILSETFPCIFPLQGEAEDAEIKVPSDENTALKGSPFEAWSRSV